MSSDRHEPEQLTQLAIPGGTGQAQLVRFKSLIQRLIELPHPHLLRLKGIEVREGQICIRSALESGQRPPTSPSQRQLSLWAVQLCAVACHLLELGFPLGQDFAAPDGLTVGQGNLLVSDPGFASAISSPPDLPAALAAYGRALQRLAGSALPAQLQWIASRCQARPDLSYRDFEEVAEALQQNLRVEERPPAGRLIRAQLPLLEDFQLPRLADRPRRPKSWLMTLLLLLALGFWGWLSRTDSSPPPRNYPAALLMKGRELSLLDLNTGAQRRRTRLGLPALAICRAGNFLFVACRGSHQLHRLDSKTLEVSNGPIIEPDPGQIAADPSGRHLYLLYPQKARALALRLPQTPQRYLDLSSGAYLAQPLMLAPGRPALAVANREPPGLEVYGLESGIAEHRRDLSGIQHMTTDSAGHLWVSREEQLLELSPGLETTTSLSLPEPVTALLAMGQTLVCARAGGLSTVANGTLLQRPLPETPLGLAADPHDSNRIWVLSRKELTCLDLSEGEPVHCWTLDQTPDQVCLLP